jgi:histone-lysine N-methyltransferase SETD3
MDTKFQVFDKWLADNGAKFHKLELRDYGDEMRACHAVSNVDEEETIVEVPLKCLITVEMGKDTQIGRAILDSNIELDAPKHIFLMIFMLLDRQNPRSFFQPYYDILPPSLSNMPIFWTPTELGYLEGSYLLQQIEERKAAITADYVAICNIAPDFGLMVTLEEFKWARMCVCSRNFGLIVNGVRTAALVPYADMLNHYRPRETKWQFDDRSQAFTIVAIQGIQASAQVYDSYGQKCNHRFLLNYGFSVEHNVEPDGFCPNETPLYLQLKRSDPLYDQKCSFWRRDGSLPSRRIRVSVCDSDNSRVMFAMLRIIEADQDDFEKLVSGGGSPGAAACRSVLKDAHAPICIANELRAMRLLRQIVDEYLDAYPMAYEDDCRRLASTDAPVAPFSNERHALIHVKGEKEVLLFYRDFAEVACRMLEMRDDDAAFDRELTEMRAKRHPVVQQYLTGALTRLRSEERQRKDKYLRPTAV